MSEARDEIIVAVGAYAVARAPAVLVALGLGSCVAVILHDPGVQTAALAHVMLPSPSLVRDRGHPSRFAATAVPLLVGVLREHGADGHRLVARLAGGAAMFMGLIPTGTMAIGERNVHALRDALRGAGVPVVGEAVGQDFGRSVWFDVARGTAVIRSVGRDEQVI